MSSATTKVSKLKALAEMLPRLADPDMDLGTQMKTFVGIVLLLALVASRNGALARLPERQILGIRLRMTEQSVHERLKAIGTLVRKEEKRQEVWQIRNASFSHLIVGFNKENRLRYVTAVSREDKDAKRVSYDQIGDLKQAKQAGDPRINNFNYQWDLAADKTNSHMQAIAMGRDPKLLTTYTLKSLEENSTADEND